MNNNNAIANDTKTELRLARHNFYIIWKSVKVTSGSNFDTKKFIYDKIKTWVLVYGFYENANEQSHLKRLIH